MGQVGVGLLCRWSQVTVFSFQLSVDRGRRKWRSGAEEKWADAWARFMRAELTRVNADEAAALGVLVGLAFPGLQSAAADRNLGCSRAAPPGLFAGGEVSQVPKSRTWEAG